MHGPEAYDQAIQDVKRSWTQEQRLIRSYAQHSVWMTRILHFCHPDYVSVIFLVRMGKRGIGDYKI